MILLLSLFSYLCQLFLTLSKISISQSYLSAYVCICKQWVFGISGKLLLFSVMTENDQIQRDYVELTNREKIKADLNQETEMHWLKSISRHLIRWSASRDMLR